MCVKGGIGPFQVTNKRYGKLVILYKPMAIIHDNVALDLRYCKKHTHIYVIYVPTHTLFIHTRVGRVPNHRGNMS